MIGRFAQGVKQPAAHDLIDFVVGNGRVVGAHPAESFLQTVQKLLAFFRAGDLQMARGQRGDHARVWNLLGRLGQFLDK